MVPMPGGCPPLRRAAGLYEIVREYLLALGTIDTPVLVEPIRQVPRQWSYAPDARVDLTKGEILTSDIRSGASAVINRWGYWEAIPVET